MTWCHIKFCLTLNHCTVTSSWEHEIWGRCGGKYKNYSFLGCMQSSLVERYQHCVRTPYSAQKENPCFSYRDHHFLMACSQPFVLTHFTFMQTFTFLHGLLFYPEEGDTKRLRSVATSSHGYILLHTSTIILIFT